MKFKIEMNVKNICFIAIIVICIFALSYGIYYQIFGKHKGELNTIPTPIIDETASVMEFDDLFDNKINMQDSTVRKFCR